MKRLPVALLLLLLAVGPVLADIPIRVLIYSHDGASKTDYIERALENCNRYGLVPGHRFVVTLGSYDPTHRLDASELEGFDVLLISGGWVDTFHPNWNREDIRAFVRDGGGYVGICAGEILAIEGVVDDPFFGYYEGLEIAPNVTREQPEWVGSRNIRFTREGAEALGMAGDLRVLHWNGSILRYKSEPPGGKQILATFGGNQEDLENPAHGKDLWRTDWEGGGAIIGDFFGKGRVLLCSPHPEHPRGTARYQSPRLVGNMVRWAFRQSNAPAIAVGRDVVFPETRTVGGLEAVSTVVATDVRLEELSVYVRHGRGPGLLGLYSDEEGAPGELLAQSGTLLLRPEGGWVTGSLENPVAVPAGRTIWLAWQFQETVSIAAEKPRYGGDTGDSTLLLSSASWTGALPQHFPKDAFAESALVSALAVVVNTREP
jgi:glutamine amidotransferase-like uncharacterized protein